MPLPIDHLVLAVRDLDGAAATYDRLGFLVGPRNQHPWGTANRLVILPGAFLELISVAEPGLIPAHGPGFFSFGAAVRDALQTGEGLAMLALRSQDARADAARFKAANLGDFEPFSFSRAGVDADGQPVTVGFTLAFSASAHPPGLHIFTCQHRNAGLIWPATPLAHPNHALGLAGVLAVMENPSDHHIHVGTVADQREMHATSLGVRLDTGGGMIELLTPTALALETGFQSEPERQLRRDPSFAGYRIIVAELDALVARLKGHGFTPIRHASRVVLASQEAHGVTLVFETAATQPG